MKQSFFAILLALSIQSFAQIGINSDASAPDPSAMIDVKATDKGMLVPRMNTVQRNAISSPSTGLIVFDTDQEGFFFYNGNTWQNLSQGGQWATSGNTLSLSDNTLNVGIGTNTPSGKLMVKADANHVSTAPIFEVQNNNGQTIFAVFDGWVEIYGNDNATGKTGEKGGLEVAGYDNTKGITRKYFSVSDDSVRFYIADGSVKTGEKGGLEVAGYDNTKTAGRSYLRVTTDSTIISFDQSAAKTGEKGGLEVAAYDNAKSTGNIELMRVTPDSTSVQDLIGQTSFILPRYTHEDIKLMENVPVGSLVFDTDSASFAVYNGTTWIESDGETFTPAVAVDGDGNPYSSIVIGSQEWLLENLKTTKYNDGTAIPNVTVDATWAALSTPAYTWYSNNEATYKNLYGALYNWYAVDAISNGGKNLCPIGWHVPNDTEWSTLATALGGLSVAGGAMKQTGTVRWYSPNIAATNTSGFTGLPAGQRFDTGTFYGITLFALFWSTTALNASDAFAKELHYNYDDLFDSDYNKKYGFSVRCIRD